MNSPLKHLSEEEMIEYNKLKDKCIQPNEWEALEISVGYYLDYCKKINHIPSDKVGLAFKCAYFMAEKSQVIFDMNNKAIRGISFSLNSLLKEHTLDDTMLMLKQLSGKVSLDKDTSVYLKNVVKEISSLITFFTKLEKTLQKLKLQYPSNQPEYPKLFSSFIWLLFISCKNVIFDKDKSTQLLPNTFLLAHIVSSMIYLSLGSICSYEIESRLHKVKDEKQKRHFIKLKVSEMFCIQDTKTQQYVIIATQFQNHFNDLLSIMKYSEDQINILSRQYIKHNYNQLDRYYNKKYDQNQLDERIFFKGRVLNLTPSKFTPFARQGYLNKLHKPTLGGKLSNGNKEQQFSSHRILNYDMITQKQIDKKTINIHEMKLLPKTIMQSPSMVKVPYLCQTPLTAGMQMYNYLNSLKQKKLNQTHSQQKREVHKKIKKWVQMVFHEKNRIRKDEAKIQLIFTVYKVSSDEYLLTNQAQKDSVQLHKAFLALSIELVFFVSNISLSFEEIEEILKIDSFQMWKTVDYFLKSDKSTPSPLKLHLLDLQVNLISFKVWKIKDFGKFAQQIANKSYKNRNDVDYIHGEKFFKRLLHQIAFQTTRLTTLLNIDESISENVFETLKEIIANSTDLFQNRHIDQLVVCAIFAICKISKVDIKFIEIKECYENSNPNLRDIVNDIICNVFIREGETGKDVIKFYNEIFVKRQEIKNFILTISQNGGSSSSNRNNIRKNPILMSPMKAIIPKQINFKAQNKNKVKGNNTPNTQLLVAYNQSPFMKYEHNPYKGVQKTKKVLNYEEEEEKFTKGHEEDTRIDTTETNAFLQKRFVSGTQARKPTLKQNKNNGPLNSHRSLFDDKKQPYPQSTHYNGDETKPLNTKMYQFSNYRYGV